MGNSERDRGWFITFEGLDGSGKTTQAHEIADWLSEVTGQETVVTFEPFHKDPDIEKKPKREQFDYFVRDREAHVRNLILPALVSGKNVICDRYIDSTWAYQCYGANAKNDGRVDFGQGLVPDATVLLWVNLETMRRRIKKRDGLTVREMPYSTILYPAAQGYRILMSIFPNRYIEIDGSKTPEQVTAKVKAALSKKLGF